MRIVNPIIFISSLLNKPIKQINTPFQMFSSRIDESDITHKPFLDKINLNFLNNVNETFSSFQNNSVQNNILTNKYKSNIQTFMKITRFYAIIPIFILNSVSNIIEKKTINYVLSYELMKIQAITILFAFGSYVINDCFDYYVDIINKPDGVFQERKMSLKQGFGLSFILFSIGIIISQTMNSNIQHLTIKNCLLLILYTPFFKEITLIKNMLCSYVIANSVLMSSLPNTYCRWISIFNSRRLSTKYFYISVFLMTMHNEINYDIRDVIGDKVMNIYTLPVKYGIKNSIKISKIFKFLAYLFLFLTTLVLEK